MPRTVTPRVYQNPNIGAFSTFIVIVGLLAIGIAPSSASSTRIAWSQQLPKSFDVDKIIEACTGTIKKSDLYFIDIDDRNVIVQSRSSFLNINKNKNELKYLTFISYFDKNKYNCSFISYLGTVVRFNSLYGSDVSEYLLIFDTKKESYIFTIIESKLIFIGTQSEKIVK